MAVTNKTVAKQILERMKGVIAFKETQPQFPEDTDAITLLGKQGRIRIRVNGEVKHPDRNTGGAFTGGAEQLFFKLRSDKELALALRQEVLERMGRGTCTIIGAEPIPVELAVAGAAEF